MKADNSSVPTPSKNPSKRVRCDQQNVAQKVCAKTDIMVFSVVKRVKKISDRNEPMIFQKTGGHPYRGRSAKLDSTLIIHQAYREI